MISAGKGKYRVWLRKIRQGGDMILLLGGGKRPHIGAIVVSEKGKKTKVFVKKGHLDHKVTKTIAQKAAKKMNKTVVCVAGIHIDNATKEDIKKLVKNCREIEKKL
ncbi:Uncharacterised protein [uncultured archaeon]|nr:Uncharacterised protein [uncultured archaeon]